MLLPSALSCDFLAPSATQSSSQTVSPLCRATRITSPSPYNSPPQEHSGIISVTTTGWVQACRRLQQILSVDRLSPSPVAPAPTLTLANSQTGIRKNVSRRIAALSSSSSSLEPFSTPLRRGNGNSRPLPRTPARRGSIKNNKRPRSTAFSSSATHLSTDCDENALNREAPVTPQRHKRQRLTTPPPPPNRGPTRRRQQQQQANDSEDTLMMDWTDDDDRQLVEMVLGKLKLSKTDWEECARTLGKGDSKSIGKRWENLLGSIALRNRRRSRIGRRR